MRAAIKPGTGRLLIVAATAALAIGLTAGPAAAAATWTILPGGAFTGTSGTTTLKDTHTGTAITCGATAISGTFKAGSGQTDPIGQITGTAFGKCTGPLGLAFNVTGAGLPWPINAQVYNPVTGTTTGTITNIRASLAAAGCTFSMAGVTATTPFTATFSYVNKIHTMTIMLPRTMHIWNVAGCFGLINNGDSVTVSFSKGFLIAPAERITSP